MKRLQVLLATLFAFAMIAAACGGSSDTTDGGDDSPTTTKAEAPEEIPAATVPEDTESDPEETATTAAPEEPSNEPVSGGTLVLANQVQAQFLNANLASGTAVGIPSTQLFASPLKFDAEYNPQPYLAESWAFTNDGLTLTLNLVDNAVFHDGTPIKASDVAFSIAVNQTNHPFKPMFAPVESVDTPDDTTVVINLSKPHPGILLAMSPALLPVIPEHIYGEAQEAGTMREFEGNFDPDVLVGSGPFVLDDFDTANGLVRMSRFDDFFEGPAYLDGVVIQIIPDANTALIALENEEVHITNLQGVADVARAKEIENLVVTPRGSEGLGVVVSLQFNVDRVADKEVRQAIAYAIDKDFIINELHQGLPFRAKSPIHPGSPFYDDSIEGYEFDLAKAAELLDAAGYPADADGRRDLSFTIDYIPTAADYQQNVAEYIRSALDEVGIDIEVRTSPDFPTYGGILATREYDMTMQILFMWADPTIGVHRSFLEANIVPVPFANNSAYINSELEAILDKAGQAGDIAERTALYADAQAILAEDVPFHWIETLPTHSVYQQNVQNPPLTIWGTLSPLNEVWLSE